MLHDESVAQTLFELERQRQDQLARIPGKSIASARDNLMLAVGPDAARFLSTLIQATRATRVLEIGGSMGYSTIWQAAAVRKNRGQLITLEQVPHKIEALRQRVAQAGLEDTVQVVAGDARETLHTLEGPFDLVLIDAWKEDYPYYLETVLPKLRIGGLIVADNMTWPVPIDSGIAEYQRLVRSHPALQTQLIPIGSGLELSVKVGEVEPPSLGHRA